MSEVNTTNIRLSIHPEFFCDGQFYVLTSFSLGGGAFTTSEIAEILGGGAETQIQELLQQGVCLPLYFEPDCELDRVTQFVVGEMTEEEHNQWIGRIIGKLNIPCGKFVLLCGGGDRDAFDTSYIIRLTPLVDAPPLPKQIEEIGWCGDFEFRQPN